MIPVGGSETIVNQMGRGQNPPLTVYVQVYKNGVTDGTGQGANISCYLQSSFGIRQKMLYNSFFTGSTTNDQYFYDVNVTLIPLGRYNITTYCVDESDNSTLYQNNAPAILVIAPPATTGQPTTGQPTTAQPTTAIPTTAIPTTGVPTTGVPILPCSRLGLRSRCRDIICGYYNTLPPSSDVIPDNGGVASINVIPSNYSKVLVYTMTGITGSPYRNTSATIDGTYFELWIDSGTAQGQAFQLIITYDWTGDGSWDRTESFPFFATDPNVGYELYKNSVKNIVTGGGVVGDPYSNFFHGKIRLEMWSALAVAGPISIRTDTVTSGQLSFITIPYIVNYWDEPNNCVYPIYTTGIATTGRSTTGVATTGGSTGIIRPTRQTIPDDVSFASRIEQRIYIIACLFVILVIL